jgi:hypothetical protein
MRAGHKPLVPGDSNTKAQKEACIVVRKYFRFLSAKKRTAAVAYRSRCLAAIPVTGVGSFFILSRDQHVSVQLLPFSTWRLLPFRPPLIWFALTYSSSPNRPLEDFQIPPAPKTPVTCIYKVQYCMIAGGGGRGGRGGAWILQSLCVIKASLCIKV